jgi:hypothetical protein
MIAIILETEQQLKYLRHIFESYTRSGLQPAELGEAALLHVALSNAAEVPMPAPETPLNLGKATITELSPNKLVLETGDPIVQPI